MSDNQEISANDDEMTCLVRTKPCWICGQHSTVVVPILAWNDFSLRDKPLDTAWPAGSHEDKQLIITGVHAKCWDEEFPDNGPKD